MESYNMQIMTNFKAIGKTDREKEKDFMSIQMEMPITGTGRMI